MLLRGKVFSDKIIIELDDEVSKQIYSELSLKGLIQVHTDEEFGHNLKPDESFPDDCDCVSINNDKYSLIDEKSGKEIIIDASRFCLTEDNKIIFYLNNKEYYTSENIEVELKFN